MGEMPLTFDSPLIRTVSKKGEVSVTLKSTGHKRTRYFTCVLSCTECADYRRLRLVHVCLIIMYVCMFFLFGCKYYWNNTNRAQFEVLKYNFEWLIYQ